MMATQYWSQMRLCCPHKIFLTTSLHQQDTGEVQPTWCKALVKPARSTPYHHTITKSCHAPLVWWHVRGTILQSNQFPHVCGTGHTPWHLLRHQFSVTIHAEPLTSHQQQWTLEVDWRQLRWPPGFLRCQLGLTGALPLDQQLCVHHQWRCCVLEFKETGHSFPVHDQSGVHLTDACHEGGCLDMGLPCWNCKATPLCNHSILQQSVSNCCHQKWPISCTYQAYWY